MRKHINNHVYDTDTARLIGMTGCEHNQKLHDAGIMSPEKLYRKMNGEFFICRPGYTAGHKKAIEPITFEQATEWACEYLGVDMVETLLNQVKPGDRIPLLVKLDREIYTAVRIAAAANGETLTRFVDRAIRKALASI